MQLLVIEEKINNLNEFYFFMNNNNNQSESEYSTASLLHFNFKLIIKIKDLIIF